MTQPSTYALLAAASYADIRTETRNQAPIPSDWAELTQYAISRSGANGNVLDSGLSARVYRGPAGEIAISLAGTEFSLSAGAVADFLNGNIPLALGKKSDQAYEAAALYQRVKREQGPNITFTGHSLGGGLAGVMAVWFNRPAYVFAPAPFQSSADSTQATTLPDGFSLDRVLPYVRYKLGSAIDPYLASYNPSTDFSAREANVRAWAVTGEVLEATLGSLNWIEGHSDSLLSSPNSQLGMFAKHSIDLHAAALLSTTFDEWAAKIPTALPRIFDSALYGNNPLGASPDFLIKLNRNEVGVRETAANGMLSHFAADLKKLGSNIISLNTAAQDAILSQGIEWYYWQNSSYSGKEFISQSGGLLQYATAQGDMLPGALNKASPYVDKWLTPLLNNADEFGGSINFQQWNVNTSPGASTATARDTGKTQIYIGNAGVDKFTGGSQADLFLSGAGNDLLNGGEGNDVLCGEGDDDTLVGGSGNDRLKGGTGIDCYVFDAGYGSDTIDDSDGKGSVVIGGSTMKGGKKEQGKSYYEDKATGTIYQWFGSKLSIARKGVSGQVTVENWSNGNLGIRLIEEVKKPNQVTSPIVLDMDGDGIETVSALAGVHFDHDGDGFAELTGWVAPDDALLVRDLNENGQIDSGAELFGANTVGPDNTLAPNGFIALSKLDVNGDKIISGAELTKLGIWRDTNQNGTVDENELRSIADEGIRSLATAYINSSIVDANGNQHRQIGSYITREGGARSAVDVWFANDRADSIAKPLDQPLPPDVVRLPDIEGYGTVRSLRESMVSDERLKTLVQQFVQEADPAKRLPLMRDILWQWTGASQQAFDSRGDYIRDARWLYMVERLTGEPYRQLDGINGGTRNPGPNAAEFIYSTSRTLFELFYGRMMAGSHLRALYSSITSNWDEKSNIFVVNYSGAATSLAAAIVADKAKGMTLLLDFVQSLRAQGLLTRTARDQLMAGLSQLGSDVISIVTVDKTPTGLDLYPGNILRGGREQDSLYGGNGRDILYGEAGMDYLEAQAGEDDLYGGDGDDILTGGDGNDLLKGGAGQDTLHGSTGSDLLLGGEGSDTYIIMRGDGEDTIREEPHSVSPEDTISFIGLSPSDMKNIERRGDSLYLTYGPTDRLKVTNYFADANVERISFSNGAAWSEASVKSLVKTIGTDSSDDITGYQDGSNRIWAGDGDDTINAGPLSDTVYGDSGADRIYAGSGMDFLFGGAGDDSLSGEAGNDYLIGGSGTDHLNGGDGNDVYIFSSGDLNAFAGQLDSILEGGGRDAVYIDKSIEVTNVELDNFSGDLKILFNDSTGLTLMNAFRESVEDLHTATKVYSVPDLIMDRARSKVQYSTYAGETIVGGMDEDRLTANGNGSLLKGGKGNDTYIINPGVMGTGVFIRAGDGYDVLKWSPNASDTGNYVEFGSGISYESLALEGSGLPDPADGYYFGLIWGGGPQEMLDLGRIDVSLGHRPFDELRFQDGRKIGWQQLLQRGVLANNEWGTALNDTFNWAELGTALGATLTGRAGDDTYVFRYGAGAYRAEISDVGRLASDREVVKFEDLTRANAVFTKEGNDLTIQRRTYSDPVQWGYYDRETVVVKNAFTTNPVNVRFQGEDRLFALSELPLMTLTATPTAGNDYLRGTSVSNAFDGMAGDDLIEGLGGVDTLLGNAGNDYVYGGDGNDILRGGTGNDFLSGDAGADVYHFARGDGADVIQDYDGTGATDKLQFAAGIAQDQLWFRRAGNGLEVSVIGSSDKITVLDWYDGAGHQIEQFSVASGKSLTAGKVNALVDAMAAFAPPAAGQTTLPATYQTALNGVIAANWA